MPLVSRTLSPRLAVALGLVLGAAVGVTTAACRDDSPPAQPCRNVPDGGCPRSRGLACEDPACKAVYLCREDNTWELEKLCPPREAAAGPVTPPPDAAVTPRDAGFVLPPGASGGPGCRPLQPPDCPLATGFACATGCCGCEDLFVCEDAGWTPWGSCGDAGPERPR